MNFLDRVLQAELARRRSLPIEGSDSAAPLIPESMGFRAWCQSLGDAGLKVDQHPFTLANRQSMWEIFDQIPTTMQEAYGRTLVIQKAAQMGATIFEQLAALYFALKFPPCQCLMYLPDRSMAGYKSTNRFMPIVRSVPSIHSLIMAGKANEGNVLTRIMPSIGSGFLFLWTHGKEGGVTESFPGDFMSLDEVQGVTLEQVDRVTERLSASRIRYRLMLSTPLWPELDINAFYLLGDQRKFHSRCGCESGVVLTDLFLQSALRGQTEFPVGWRDGELAYRCPTCGQWIDDAQVGEWRPHNPVGRWPSFHLSQVLSPTITPHEILSAWHAADTVARRQNVFCRKFGSPLADDSQILATAEILRECARVGVMLGLTWESSGDGCIMGVDQMGSFCVVTIGRVHATGRLAVIHVELVYALDPWSRLDELMALYRIPVCVIEQLPNIDSARQFAHRHQGRVWLITSYGDLEDFVSWGDVIVSKSDRKTQEDYRDRYTLRADQYRVLDWVAARFREQFIIFPDPALLAAEVKQDGVSVIGRPLSDVFWVHYQKTGLVLEEPDQDPKDKSVKQPRRRVLKLGLDPHASFSLMCLALAWFRSHGTSHFILPGVDSMRDKDQSLAETVEKKMPGLPVHVLGMLERETETCGRCDAYRAGLCQERGAQVRETDPACDLFVALED